MRKEVIICHQDVMDAQYDYRKKEPFIHCIRYVKDIDQCKGMVDKVGAIYVFNAEVFPTEFIDYLLKLEKPVRFYVDENYKCEWLRKGISKLIFNDSGIILFDKSVRGAA